MLYAPIQTQAEFEGRIKLSSEHGVGTPEDHLIDFKTREPMEAQREYARDVAQFANTHGGVLVVGVEAPRDPATGRDTARGVAPIPDDQEGALVRWTEQALSNYLYPAYARPVPLFFDPWGKGKVMVVNVEPSATLLAVWRQSEAHHGIEFVYRTSEGRAWFTPEEATRMENWSTRATRIKMESVLKRRASQTSHRANEVHLVPRLAQLCVRPDLQRTVYDSVDGVWPSVERLEDDEFTLVIFDGAGASKGVIRLPYQYVNFAWEQTDGVLALDLAVQICWTEREGWTHLSRDTPPP